MSNHSQKWEFVPLAEAAPIDTRAVLPTDQPDTEFNYIALENIESGTGRLVDLKPVRGDAIRSNKFAFDTTHVLLGKLRPYLNKVVVPHSLGICSTDILPLLPNMRRLSREWLAVCLRSTYFIEYSRTKMDGAKMPRLRTPDLESFEIPVPALTEQRRLVARIVALTSRLELARQDRQAALAEAASSYHSIVAAAFDRLDTTPARTLGTVTAIIGGAGFREDGPEPASEEDRVGLLKVSDMNSEGNETAIQSCRVETTLASAKKQRLRIVPCGAVVFPKRGGAIATNKKRTLAIPAALDPNMMGVYPLEGSGLSSAYLRWWFESIDLADLQEDGGIPQVNKKHLDPLEILIPKPAEQRRIVARLEAFAAKHAELRRLQSETEAELAAFSPALLAKAFRGEL